MSSQLPGRPATSGAPLKGHWQFQLCEQTIRLPSGEVLEVIRQEPPQAAERFLDITDHELITTHEYDADGVTALGRRYYEVVREYYREGNSIFVSMPGIPSIAPRPHLIQQLDDHKLVLFVILTSAPGYPVTEVASHYIR